VSFPSDDAFISMIMQVRKFGLCGFMDFFILAQPNYYAGVWKKRKKN
jgi:hypothetical protein